MKQIQSENATETDNRDNGNLSLLNLESLFPIPDLFSSISQCLSDDVLIVYDLEKECKYATVKGNGMYYVSETSTDQNRVIVADWKNRRMEVYENKEPINISITQAVIDLDANGRRWEGGVRNDKPFGYGILYNEEGQKEYEGFLIDGVKTCYGIDYYNDINRVKYDGCYCNNNRFGRGVLYDRNGGIEYQGLWKNNKPCSPQFDGKTIDNLTESIDIPNVSFRELESFIIQPFTHSLKHIIIGDGSFVRVRLFELDGLYKLESVVIGEISFTYFGTEYIIDIDDCERSDGSCRIMNCPSLKSIHIRDYSFCDYQSFELSNLPSLESIDIGKHCFHWSPTFSLIDLPQLRSVKLGEEAFCFVQSVMFENLPNLQSIQLDKYALCGDGGDDRKTIEEEPYYYKNILTMKNLPSLTDFKGQCSNFSCIGSVILENIPRLSSDGIQSLSFYYTYSLQSSSTLYLLSSSLDAVALDNLISFGEDSPSPEDHVVKNRAELDSIPLDVQHLCIGRLDTSGITEFSFNSFQSIQSLVIGNNMFWEGTRFELSNLPSLQFIQIGKDCFMYAVSFSLTDLPQLQSVQLGFSAFCCVHSVVFENLPKLQSIQLDAEALRGDACEDRKTIEEKPYNLRNTLTMRNLPSLTFFKGELFNFGAMGSVILENIPQLSTDGIQFNENSHFYTYSLQSLSMNSPISSSFDATALDNYIRNRSNYL